MSKVLELISKVEFNNKKTFAEVYPQLKHEEDFEKMVVGSSGKPLVVNISNLEDLKKEYDATVYNDAVAQFIPLVDDYYRPDIDFLRKFNIAMAVGKPMLYYGHYGTGKTTAIEQACANTKRPYLRVQHTISMEESHVLGQMSIVIDKETQQSITEFKPGPLAIAMKYGLLYLADEYDFALPAVTSVYQPVLEGKPLYIKEAPEDSGWRFIKPHKNFRFVATGNTNGQGDDTGLYTGTQRMNAANYSRFVITMQAKYMEQKKEAAIIIAQAGLTLSDGKANSKVASAFARLANQIRHEFDDNNITVTISPRELINAALLGKLMGGNAITDSQWREGLALAYTNRLSPVDRKMIDDLAQRHFGGKIADAA